MVEKKVYSEWANSENQFEKRDVNAEIYNELRNKYKINQGEDSDIIYRKYRGYAKVDYVIEKCPDELTDDEIALICDDGNLCFGYRGSKDSRITVITD